MCVFGALSREENATTTKVMMQNIFWIEILTKEIV